MRCTTLTSFANLLLISAMKETGVSEQNLPIYSSQDEDRERLDLIVNANQIGIWDWQVQTGLLTCNHHWAEMLGFTLDELEPINFNTWSENLHPDDLIKAEKALKQHFTGQRDIYIAELQLRHKSGDYVWVKTSGKVIEWNDDRKPTRMLGIHLNINEEKKKDESLLVISQLLNQSQQIAKVGGWELDLKTGVLFWTDETYRIHDTSPDEFNPTVDAGVGYFLPESKELISKALDDAINHGIGYDLELQTYTTKHRLIDVRTTCVVTQENGVSRRLTGIFQDICEQKAIQRRLEQSNAELAGANSALKYSAHYDPLTGLPNRYLLADRMQQAITKSVRNETFVAVAFIDVDGFKAVNDSYGHDVGDELLKRIASELKSTLREGDTLSRIGGDEFVAILDNLSEPSESKEILSRMLEAVRQPLTVSAKDVHVSASIGLTIYPIDSDDPDHLLRHADQAMYVAKQKGKNCYHMFDIEND